MGKFFNFLENRLGESPRGFESLFLRQTKTGKGLSFPCFVCVVPKMKRDSRVGAVLREQNALPYETWITVFSLAKDDVDNVGAGRAAKGENPSSCAKQKQDEP